MRKKTVHSSSLEQRLLDEAARLKKRAEKMSDGEARDSLLRKAQQNEDAAHMNKWLTSPGLQPPKATYSKAAGAGGRLPRLPARSEQV